MRNIIPDIVRKTKDAPVLLLGESHSITHHKLLACLISEALKAHGFNTLFLELDTSYQKTISYVIDQPTCPSNTKKWILNTDREKEYIDTVLNFADPDRRKKMLGFKLADGYSFIPSMVGNSVAYHQFLKVAHKTFENILAIDEDSRVKGLDNKKPEGMKWRNDFMAAKIAEQVISGNKGIALVGSDHLKYYKEKGTKVKSLQAVLLDNYNIHSTTLIFSNTQNNTRRYCREIAKEDIFYTGIRNCFSESKYALIQQKRNSLKAPEYMAFIPPKKIWKNIRDFTNISKETLHDEFQREKYQWNAICKENNCPTLIVS